MDLNSATPDSEDFDACSTAGLDAGTSSALMARALNEIDYGVILTDAEARLHHANREAFAALRRGRALRLSEGRLRTGDAGQQSALLQALQEARLGRRRLITIGHDHDELSVAVIPMADASSSPAEPAPCLLVLGKCRPCEVLSIDFFSRAHGLTGAEAVVLHRLCSGRKPKQIACDLGVAVSTIRSQIGSVRSKTRTDSILALTRRLAALPPIAHALLERA